MRIEKEKAGLIKSFERGMNGQVQDCEREDVVTFTLSLSLFLPFSFSPYITVLYHLLNIDLVYEFIISPSLYIYMYLYSHLDSVRSGEDDTGQNHGSIQ